MIQLVDNFLDQSLVLDLLNFYIESQNSSALVPLTLEPHLSSGSFGSILSIALPDPIKTSLDNHVRQSRSKTFDGYYLTECTLQVWERGSHINWHTDDNKISLVVYLNRGWNVNWGGLFLFEDESYYGWFPPYYNRCLWFQGPMWNYTSPVTNNAEESLLMVQLFFTKS